jgi:chromate reductase
MRILGLVGSLRSGSYNRLLLDAAAEELPPGVELVVFDELRTLPHFDADDEDHLPEAVARLHEAAEQADALLIATPEYNASIPGVLKNALDWLSRPFPDNAVRNKPAAVIGASTGLFGAAFAQADAKRVLARAGARVLDGDVPVATAHLRFDEHGRLVDEEVRTRLRELGGALFAEVSARVVAA